MLVFVSHPRGFQELLKSADAVAVAPACGCRSPGARRGAAAEGVLVQGASAQSRRQGF